jgi:hypothetical protein
VTGLRCSAGPGNPYEIKDYGNLEIVRYILDSRPGTDTTAPGTDPSPAS